jgi:hypothetical protein
VLFLTTYVNVSSFLLLCCYYLFILSHILFCTWCACVHLILCYNSRKILIFAFTILHIIFYRGTLLTFTFYNYEHYVTCVSNRMYCFSKIRGGSVRANTNHV